MITHFFDKIKSWVASPSYGSHLENYINSHNPKTVYDIERLTEEFERRNFLQGDAKL